jgi:hypothetical protein
MSDTRQPITGLCTACETVTVQDPITQEHTHEGRVTTLYLRRCRRCGDEVMHSQDGR